MSNGTWGEFFENPGAEYGRKKYIQCFWVLVFGLFLCVGISQWEYVEIGDILKSIS